MKEFMIEDEIRDVAKIIKMPKGNTCYTVKRAYSDTNYPSMNTKSEEQRRSELTAKSLKNKLYKI